jgi:hypothetical protein
MPTDKPNIKDIDIELIFDVIENCCSGIPDRIRRPLLSALAQLEQLKKESQDANR